MASYYNKTRSPRAATLRDGSSQSFPPRKWVEVPEELEGSPELVRLYKLRILARRAPKPDPEPEPVPATASAPVEPEPKPDKPAPKKRTTSKKKATSKKG